MSVDRNTVLRVARLARIALEEESIDSMVTELNTILGWVEQLQEVDVREVAPLTSVVAQRLKMREDEVTAGGDVAAVTANAPLVEDHFYVVPKVVE